MAAIAGVARAGERDYAKARVSRVSVVIVSYNVRAHLERCLNVLGDGPHEVIVVDSASTDGSPESG
jgi:GT2 family glycosyltransferase